MYHSAGQTWAPEWAGPRLDRRGPDARDSLAGITGADGRKCHLPQTQRTALLTLTRITTHLHGQPSMRVGTERDPGRGESERAALNVWEDFGGSCANKYCFAKRLVVFTKYLRKYQVVSIRF